MAKKISIETNSLNFNITGNGNPTTGFTDGQIVDIPNDKIIEDNNQRFIIHEDTIQELAEHIKADGQLSPCIVFPLSDGTYELIDGRHRRRAVIEAGLPTTKCIVRNDLSDKQKQKIRLTSNLVRNNDYLPSELAFAYKELLELENNMQKVSESTSLSKKKIYRYIRLTNLINPLLSRVDNGSIPIIAAVELSYLTTSEQNKLFEYMLNHSDCKITTATAREIKEAPADLENIFYPESESEDNHYEVDNLSTSYISDNNTELSVSESDTHNVEEQSTDEVDNLSTSDEDNIISESDIETVAKAIIDLTKLDTKIIAEFYSTSEVISYIKEKYATSHNYCGCNEYSCSFKNTFNITINNKNSYSIAYKDVDKYVRDYIRKHYNRKNIISILEKN